MHALEMLGLEVSWSEMEVGSNFTSIYLFWVCGRLGPHYWRYSAFISMSSSLDCTSLYPEWPSSHHQEAVQAVDADGSGELEFPEFKIVRRLLPFS